ncbi:FG-GAP repeat domain-containing protein [Lysobacter xanthus]
MRAALGWSGMLALLAALAARQRVDRPDPGFRARIGADAAPAATAWAPVRDATGSPASYALEPWSRITPPAGWTDANGIDAKAAVVSVLLVDATRDGRRDVVLVMDLEDRADAVKESRLYVYPGDGQGGFGVATAIALAPLSANHFGGSTGAAAADMDGDGFDDIVVLGPQRPVVVTFDAQGTPAVHALPVPGARYVGVPRILDMDADGDLDLVALVYRDQSARPFSQVGINVLTNQGGLAFTQYERGGAGWSSYDRPHHVSAVPGDFNGDGWPDIAFGASVRYTDWLSGQTSELRSVFVYAHTRSRLAPADPWFDYYRFARSQTLAPIATDVVPERMVAIDLDNDGDVELAGLSDRDGRGDPVWFAQSGGLLRTPPVFATGRPTAGDSVQARARNRDLIAVDLDRDGRKDLLAAYATPDGLLQVVPFLQADTGGLVAAGAASAVNDATAAPLAASALAAADIDLDRCTDAAVNTSAGVQVLRGRGCAFTAAPPLSDPSPPSN